MVPYASQARDTYVKGYMENVNVQKVDQLFPPFADKVKALINGKIKGVTADFFRTGVGENQGGQREGTPKVDSATDDDNGFVVVDAGGDGSSSTTTISSKTTQNNTKSRDAAAHSDLNAVPMSAAVQHVSFLSHVVIIKSGVFSPRRVLVYMPVHCCSCSSHYCSHS
jgi:hypothetical protein